MRTRTSGFTLIELMIVIAILAILMTIAIPAYQDYTIRTRVTEGLSVAAPAKTAVVETFHSDGTIPDQAATGYVFPGSDYVAAVTIDNAGVVQITTQNTGATVDPVLSLTPRLVSGEPTNWTCNLVAGEARHVPGSCREAASPP